MFLDSVDPINATLYRLIITVGVGVLVVAFIGIIVQIYLAISYIKYNRKANSLGKTGEEIAREILDKNNLNHIRVSATGSLTFGNSYSHYFKKVRLRRLTYRKKSITSLAMACQKSSLAIMDAEGDPDMRKRVILTPIIFFGPLSIIPLILIGIALDILVFKTDGIWTMIFAIIAASFYLLSFVMQVLQIKTEKKAQNKAIEMMERDNLATLEEINLCKSLYRLYNIEYINNLVLEILQLILKILQITSKSYNSSKK